MPGGVDEVKNWPYIKFVKHVLWLKMQIKGLPKLPSGANLNLGGTAMRRSGVNNMQYQFKNKR